jgi:hypothetical protein
VIAEDVRLAGATIGPMTDEPLTPGRMLAKRMKELGVSKMALFQASGVSRNTINAALADTPKTRPATYANLMRVLDDIEADRADGPKRWVPSEGGNLVTIAMHGVFGVESVTFSGPAEDVDAVRQAAVDFVRQVREGIAESE